MSASTTATALSLALSTYSGALLPLYSTDTSAPGGVYGALETTAQNATAALLSALQSYTSAASILAALTVTWHGVTQSNVELVAKLYELSSSVCCLNDTDASDAASVLSYLATTHAANGN